MSGSIARQHGAYRRGLVLGFTMAEIMVLVLFLLMLAAATWIKRERDNERQAEVKLTTVQAVNRDLVGRLGAAEGERDALRERLSRVLAAGGTARDQIDSFFKELE